MFVMKKIKGRLWRVVCDEKKSKDPPKGSFDRALTRYHDPSMSVIEMLQQQSAAQAAGRLGTVSCRFLCANGLE